MAGFEDLLSFLTGQNNAPAAAPPDKSLQDRWADVINERQNGTSAPPRELSPIEKLFGSFGGVNGNFSLPGTPGSKTADSNQGFGQPGPAAPIDYARMRQILNSGVLRPPTAGGTAPAPAPVAQAPSPAPPRSLPGNPLEALMAMFGRR